MKNERTASVLIITTGGTIDKRYGVGAGIRELSFVGDSAVTTILRGANTDIVYPTVNLMAKDSLDMSDSDRAMIAAMCLAVPQNRIMITHGTDTAKKTAEAIARKRLKKTVVITAASQPAVVVGSDANFNVGFALASALTAPPGVYIAMNSQLFRWNECQKNPTTGVFEPVSAK